MKEIKCYRCNKNPILVVSHKGYIRYYIHKWGDWKLSISKTLLCKDCVNELLSKIDKALYNDRYEEN